MVRIERTMKLLSDEATGITFGEQRTFALYDHNNSACAGKWGLGGPKRPENDPVDHFQRRPGSSPGRWAARNQPQRRYQVFMRGSDEVFCWNAYKKHKRMLTSPHQSGAI